MSTMMQGRKADVLTHVPEGPRSVTVRVETNGGVYVGRLCVPKSRLRVSNVLADERQFLSLTDVLVNGGGVPEAFMAINKSFIRALRVLDEGVVS
jgi:hypothetical protein